MSLYTFSKTDSMPSIKMIDGIRMEECFNVELLSEIGAITVDDVMKRLANGHTAFVAYMNNQPAAFGWMARQKAQIGELNHQMKLPEGNRYLWNFRTLETFRGLGIYPALLQFIMNAEMGNADRFWIIHAPENKSSLSGIIKAGFQFVGKLYINENGHVAIEKNRRSDGYKMMLAIMAIPVSTQPAASCWNCSSPYLKKRIMSCCCIAVQNECVRNNGLAVAS